MRPSATFEHRFHELRRGLHWRLWRDVRCAAFILSLIWRNLTVGARVRRKYRACKRSGEVFWLDDPAAAPTGRQDHES